MFTLTHMGPDVSPPGVIQRAFSFLMAVFRLLMLVVSVWILVAEGGVIGALTTQIDQGPSVILTEPMQPKSDLDPASLAVAPAP